MLPQKSKWSTLPKSEVIGLLLVVAIGGFLRFYELASVPPGILGDESLNGLQATVVLRGEEYPLFFDVEYGKQPMHIYLEALSFHFLGPSTFAVRTVSAVVGILTVPLLYLLVKDLFSRTAEHPTRVATLASLSLAVSYWHLIYSRFGAEPVLMPFFAVLVSLFLTRAIRSQHRPYFVLTGFFLGLSSYSYQAAGFLVLLCLLLPGYRMLTDRGSLRTNLTNMLLLFLVALLVFLPLAYYALTHPGALFRRTAAVSIFNPQHNEGSPLRAFLISTAKTIGMFSLLGDPDLARNPAGRPILDPFTSAILVVGIAVAVLRYRQAPHLFVLSWLAIMSLPGAFTAQEIPNYNRTVGAVPAVCILVAIGIEVLRKGFTSEKGRIRRPLVFWTTIGLVFLWTTVSTFRDYFVSWRELGQFDRAFNEAALVMNQLQVPDSLWILPHTSLAGSGLTHSTIEFLYQGQAPHYYLSLDERTAAKDLTTFCQEHRKALVIDWKHYVLGQANLYAFSDPKRLTPFLLSKYGQQLAEYDSEDFRIVEFQLPRSVRFSITDRIDPLQIDFGGQIGLTGVSYGAATQRETHTPADVNRRTLRSGRDAWVVLRWRAVQRPSEDYKVGIYLIDMQGHVVGQTDKPLLSNSLEETSDWEPGQEEIDYYTLPTLAGTPPGWYDIQVAIYSEETMERLPVLDNMGSTVGQAATVGRLQLVTPVEPAVVQPAQTLRHSEGSLVPGIRLLGYDLPTRTFHPGDTIPLVLFWKAVGTVDRDYVIAIQLRDQRGLLGAEEQGRPVYGTYPTTEWVPGEVLRDWHDLTLDPTIPDGSYQLELQLKEAGHVSGQISLGSVAVEGRAHLFQIPEMQHYLGVRLGEQVTLLGYDLNTDEIDAGDTLTLTLYWQALTEMDMSYTVFTHLLDEQGRMWGQKDSVPGAGQLPTTSWVKGEVIEDHYEITVSGEAPPGECVLQTGMYQWETGERLPVFDEHGTPQGDRTLLTIVKVVS